MNLRTHIIFKNIVTIGLVAMFFSCTNNSEQVKDLFLTKNLPIGTTKGMNHIYKDSGRVTSKLITPLLKDFSNRKEHPYNEFPKGLILVSYTNNGKDSITIKGDYGLSYSKTKISELRGNVILINHTDKSTLETEQLYWDQNTDYCYSEKKFKLTTANDVGYGIGFESKKDLSKFIAKKTTSTHLLKENEK